MKYLLPLVFLMGCEPDCKLLGTKEDDGGKLDVLLCKKDISEKYTICQMDSTIGLFKCLKFTIYENKK